MGKLKVWIESTTGKAFHDTCFDKDESRDGYEEANLNELDDEVECEACGNMVFNAPDDDSDDDDDDEDVPEAP